MSVNRINIRNRMSQLRVTNVTIGRIRGVASVIWKADVDNLFPYSSFTV